MTDSIHIFGPQFSNFVRTVQLVCEEKGVDYTLGLIVKGEEVPFKGEQHQAWHPFKKVPVLLDGDFILSETSSICRYLSRMPGATLLPESSQAIAEVDQWCQFISIYLDKAITRNYLLEFVFPKGEDGKPRIEVIKNNIPTLRKALATVEQQLGARDFIVGNAYTLADAFLAPILYYVKIMPTEFFTLSTDSTLYQYSLRMEARDSGKAVLYPKQ